MEKYDMRIVIFGNIRNMRGHGDYHVRSNEKTLPAIETLVREGLISTEKTDDGWWVKLGEKGEELNNKKAKMPPAPNEYNPVFIEIE